MIQPRPKLLTFDCYGTLIDWATGIREDLEEVLAEKNGVTGPFGENRTLRARGRRRSSACHGPSSQAASRNFVPRGFSEVRLPPRGFREPSSRRRRPHRGVSPDRCQTTTERA